MSELRLMIVALLLVTILAILGQGKTWPLKTKAVLPGTALFPRLSTSYGRSPHSSVCVRMDAGFDTPAA